MTQLSHYRKQADKHLSDYRHASRQVKEERAALEASLMALEAAREAQGLLQQLAQEIQSQAHQRIASVVSRCLEAVFPDDPYEFKIEFQQARGKTEARLLFIRDGVEIDPITAAGGGVVDIASFALRLSCLCLMRPQPRKLIVMDEPFRFLSRDHLPRARAMLEELSTELGFQFIMVTHARLLQTGTILELE